MHNKLEDYLGEVRTSLRGLPRKRRDAELSELREHLASHAAEQEQLGLTSDAAAAATMEQFGEPAVVGNDLARAWRRGLLKSLPATALFASVLQVGVMLLARSIVRICNSEFPSAHLTAIDWLPGVVLIVGLVMGYRAPRYATFGAVFPTLIVPFLSLAAYLYSELGLAWSVVIHHDTVTSWYNWPAIMSDDLHLLGYTVIAIVGAKLGKRLTERGRGLKAGI